MNHFGFMAKIYNEIEKPWVAQVTQGDFFTKFLFLTSF